MKITYRKNGEVVMMGSEIKNEFLDTIELPDDPRMKSGEYTMKIVDGEILYELAWWKKNEIEAEQKKIDLAKDLSDIEKAKDVSELKPLILKLIQKLNP